MPKKPKIAEFRKGNIILKIYDKDVFSYIVEKFFKGENAEKEEKVQNSHNDIKSEIKVKHTLPTSMASDTSVQDLISEAVQSVDVQKERFMSLGEKKEVREVKTGNCPYCGEVGTPEKALYSQGWIHHLLVKCNGCGEKYLVHLRKENLKKIAEFEKIREKAPECELYPWKKFKEETTVIRGISE